MLCVNNYPQSYVDSCRRRVDAQLRTYRKVIGPARENAGSKDAQAFDTNLFANMVLVLEGMFVHRTRGIEKKDGNPLNEVRMIANAIMLNDGVLAADSTIKYQPDKSVLKYKIGDELKLDEAAFVALSGAYFAEIEKKFV